MGLGNLARGAAVITIAGIGLGSAALLGLKNQEIATSEAYGIVRAESRTEDFYRASFEGPDGKRYSAVFLKDCENSLSPEEADGMFDVGSSIYVNGRYHGDIQQFTCPNVDYFHEVSENPPTVGP